MCKPEKAQLICCKLSLDKQFWHLFNPFQKTQRALDGCKKQTEISRKKYLDAIVKVEALNEVVLSMMKNQLSIHIIKRFSRLGIERLNTDKI